jgi:hypothetical protein
LPTELLRSDTYNDRNRLPNEPKEHHHWCCRFPHMRARDCSSRKSNAGTRLAITGFETRVLESVGTNSIGVAFITRSTVT